MRFKPEVEGLRGVAVAIVVLAHAKLAGFGGGFVGVDVFFVISGYLITSLLARELSAASDIDYWRFYARRARRLLPALVLVCLATLVLAQFLIPVGSRSFQGLTGSLSLLWVSNIYFAFKQFDYFAEGATSSLFLHTWSLGVEEQFYLIWPAFLALAWRLCGGKRKLDRLAAVLACVTLCGYLAANWVYQRHPIPAYYLMPTRLWELSLGGVVAVAPLGKIANRPNLLRGLCVLGLALTMSSVALVPANANHLFMWLLMPVTGVALILCAAEAGLSGFRVLDNQPLRFLGRISYSLYLWHWPMLVLVRVLFQDQPIFRATFVFIAIALALGSTVLLEEPVRDSRASAPRIELLASLFASLLVAFSLQQALLSPPHHEQRLISSNEAKIRSQISTPSIYGKGCDRWYRDAVVTPCNVVGNSRPALRVLLVGDSVGAQWTPAFAEIGLRKGWDLTVLTKSSCPIADEKIYYERIGREYTECEEWRNNVVGYINDIKPDLLIFGSTANSPLTPEQWVTGTRSFLERTHMAASRVLILAPTPVWPFNPVDCLVIENQSGKSAISGAACELPLSKMDRHNVTEALAIATRNFLNVGLLDLSQLICPEGRCSSWRDGRPVFRDQQHLNANFVATLDQALAANLMELKLSRQETRLTTKFIQH